MSLDCKRRDMCRTCIYRMPEAKLLRQRYKFKGHTCHEDYEWAGGLGKQCAGSGSNGRGNFMGEPQGERREQIIKHEFWLVIRRNLGL